MKKLSVLLVLSLFSFHAMAENGGSKKLIDFDQLYVGAGLGMNSLSGWDSAIGYQFFAGAPLDIEMGGLNWSVEAGYMDSGEFKYSTFFGSATTKASGLWATAVAKKKLNKKLDLIGRAGLDIGDDDGLMYGAGLVLNLKDDSEIRFEYVMRTDINSMQANYVVRLK